ncbi:MAG: hypothetical protein QXR17_07705 [Candidatus Bathyarchaeia archaeon]
MSKAEIQEMRVKLPRYLVMWLHEYGRVAYMTVDQLLDDILEHYYEVWRTGYEKAFASNLEEYLKNTL